MAKGKKHDHEDHMKAKSESLKSNTIIQKYLSNNPILKPYSKVLEELQELLRSKQVPA